jgi:hypothetical protein
MRRCAVPSCPNRPSTRGWCTGHYSHWLRTGDVRADEPLGGKAKGDACAVEGCPDPPHAYGWCQMHHKRWQRTGDVRADEPKRGTEERLCEVDGCPNTHDARGLCHGHYQRWARNGQIAQDVTLERRRQPAICTIEGCRRRTHSKGYCRTHYARLEKYGDVRGAVPVKIAEGMGWITHGYRGVQVPPELRHLTNGETKTTEHRLVMAFHLDRPLRRDEVVHHVNGDRLDNRIENLELWSTAHPKGQRIDDKIAFAVGMLRRYRPDLLSEEALTKEEVTP